MPARTPWRKLREWAIARRLERTLSKKRILELYVNVIELGPRTYGAEAASRRYFHKPASALTGVPPSVPGRVRFPPPALGEHSDILRRFGWDVFKNVTASPTDGASS